VSVCVVLNFLYVNDWSDLLILFCGPCDLVVGKLRIIGVVVDSVTVFVNFVY
jgi:hypothetical protein